MPVTRNRIEVPSTVGQGGVVPAPGNPMVNVLGGISQQMMALAEDIGRTMAAEGEDEARRLARMALFRRDANGNPVMPPELSQGYGSAIRDTYNDLIEENTTFMIQQRVRQLAAEAENAHPYDPDAYRTRLEQGVQELATSVPPEYAAAIQMLTTEATVSGLAGIGARQTSLTLQQTGDRVPVMVDQTVSSIIRDLRDGNQQFAEASFQATYDTILNLPDEVISPSERARQLERLVLEAGLARLIHDHGLDETDDPEALALIRQQLAMGITDGGMEGLGEYFVAPGERVPDLYVMREAANRLAQLQEVANRRQTAAAESGRVGAILDALQHGGLPDSAQNRGYLDLLVSSAANFIDETGAVMEMTPEAWLAMTPAQLERATQAVRDAGMPSASLEMLFREAWNQRDVESLTAIYPIYRALRMGVNTNGVPRDATGFMPDDMLAAFQSVDAAVGSGRGNADQYRTAFMRLDVMQGTTFTQEDYVRRMREDGLTTTLNNRGMPVSRDNVLEDIRRRVIQTVFADQDIQATEEEKDRAVQLFMSRYQLGVMDFEEAMAATAQVIGSEYAETTFMNVRRSNVAPEIAYPDPPSQTVFDWAQRLYNDAAAGFAQGAEGILGEWWLDIILPGDWWDGPGPDLDVFGAERLNATAFELIADRHIREVLAAEGYEFFDQDDRSLLRGGEEYVLIENTGGDYPTYQVMMRDPESGDTVNLGVFDPGPAYRELQTLNLNLRAIDQARTDRRMQALRNELGPNGVEMRMLEAAATQGENFVLQRELDRLYEEVFGSAQ